MKLEAAINLAKSFFYCRSLIKEINEDSPSLKAMLAVLRILDFEFIEASEILVYFGDKVYGFLKPDKSKLSNKIIPVDIKNYDRECIEDILNNEKYKLDITYISPIFETIGWVLTSLSGTIRIHFEGSPTYEIWNEPLLRWDEDLDDDCCDWKSGTNWRDGLDLENIKYDWKIDLNDYLP